MQKHIKPLMKKYAMLQTPTLDQRYLMITDCHNNYTAKFGNPFLSIHVERSIWEHFMPNQILDDCRLQQDINI